MTSSPPTLRPPYIGDVLLDPPRAVCMVDRVKRTFRCSILMSTPLEEYGHDDWPETMPNLWTAAPIEPGWAELPEPDLPEP